MVTILLMVLKALIVLTVVLVNVMLVIYFERKLLADIQIRFGPMRVGPHGALQLIADILKLLLKEDIIPTKADRLLFILGPIIMFIPTFILYLTVPLTKSLVVKDLDIGIFYIFAVTGIIPVGVIIAGWSSYNKYSVLGGLRAAAQQISYEVPILLSMLGVIMISGSLSLVSIVEAQKPIWFIFLQPFAFLFYLTAAIAELNRTPFDIPEAESELVAGYMTEFSGMRFAFFFLVEYSNLFLVSAIATLVFLGGWNGPILPPLAWFLLKTYAMVFLIVWLRGTLPRVRIDQLMDLSWKILLPLALANIMITAVLLL